MISSRLPRKLLCLILLPVACTQAAVLYVANLAPPGTAANSTASGIATVLFDAASNTASVNVTFSNLTSAEVVAHLELGNPATAGTYVLTLAQGQVEAQSWTFQASGQFSSSDIVNALKTGNIYVDIDSSNYPNGELQGKFIQSNGSQAFVAPSPPPPLPAAALAAPLSKTDASRFLAQATFGATQKDIDALSTTQSVNAWLSSQLSAAPSSHLKGTRNDATNFKNAISSAAGATNYFTVRQNRMAAWWKITLTGQDQLRQRMAYALSQILVVSDSQSTLSQIPEAMAGYYDILVNGAFGNFRDLLENVTLSPVMGVWLSSLRNQKGDATKGTSADENYAREIQQLFTIGLVQLQPDGTLLLDSNGLPIPTYNQATIVETAKVFTGWSFVGTNFFATAGNGGTNPGVAPAVLPDNNGWLVPMQYYDAYHDHTAKTVISLQQGAPGTVTGTAVPADASNLSGPRDLKIMLDTLFNHPNTGPYICTQLIQQLVTSNPSPGYVYRVSQVFANNGSGVRGDLGAVAKAILTDYEARSAAVTGNVGYGKVQEPILRTAALLRAYNASAPNGRFANIAVPTAGQGTSTSNLTNPESALEQAPVRSATVFNFYSPDYVVPGPLASAGLVAPVMQIVDASSAITVPNYLYSIITTSPTSGSSNFSYTITLDYSALTPLLSSPGSMVDQVNLLLCGNSMSGAMRLKMITALQNLPSSATNAEKAQTAVYLAITSPESAVQR